MRLVLVLGMHRSGTSCLTGLLEDAGVFLGDVARASPHNLRGNNENSSVMDLNKAVLAANDSSWNHPPDGPVSWNEEHSAAAAVVLDELLAPGRVTAIKDPRCVYTGDGWRQAAQAKGADLAEIGTFRRPEKVVGSLRTRGPHLDEDRCYELWRLYNEEILARHRDHPFPIVDFDLPVDEYLASVERAFVTLGLPAPTGELFFTEELRRQPAASSSHPELEPLYDQLRAAAV